MTLLEEVLAIIHHRRAINLRTIHHRRAINLRRGMHEKVLAINLRRGMHEKVLALPPIQAACKVPEPHKQAAAVPRRSTRECDRQPRPPGHRPHGNQEVLAIPASSRPNLRESSRTHAGTAVGGLIGGARSRSIALALDVHHLPTLPCIPPCTAPRSL